MSHSSRRTFLKVSGAVLGGIATGTTVTAATRTDRFIVETRGNVDFSGLEVIHEMPGTNYVVVRGDESDIDGRRGIQDYARDLELRLTEPEVNEKAPTLEDVDITESEINILQWDKIDLNVPEAHETTEGDGTLVTIIDSGVLETHPDLAGPLNVKKSRNFTDDGGDHNPVDSDHGTHVAGITASNGGGGFDVYGTAPETELVDCRVFSGPAASFADILAALVYSANIGADVANLSLGAYPVPREGMGDFYGKVLNSTMTYVNKEGTLLSIAAGNAGADLQRGNRVCVDEDGNIVEDEEDAVECFAAISLPNEGAQAVSVSATGPIGYLWGEEGLQEPPESPAFYTNFGTNAITLGAPGGDADLQAAAAEVPGWFQDLVFNTVFIDSGTLVSGTFGPDSDEYEGEMTVEYVYDPEDTKDDNLPSAVRAYGNPPFTDDAVSWWASVGFAGVQFDVESDFSTDKEIAVDYEVGDDHERSAPDWIAAHVTVDEEDYVAIDWQIDLDSGGSVTLGDLDDVFEASSVVEIFDDNDINPSSPDAEQSDLQGGTVQSVGVFSGGGVGRDDSVDIYYEQVYFEETELLYRYPNYGWKAGTSMAAPNVAGAAALVKSENPNYNANQVVSALKRAAEVPDDYDKRFYGAGYLNILDAL